MTDILARLPTLTLTHWLLLAALTLAVVTFRDELTQQARDAVDGHRDTLATYGGLAIGGFIAGYYWAGSYPTTPTGVLEVLISWLTSLLPL